MPQTTSIYTSPNDSSRFNYLQVSNYLSEFKTDIDKARVRYNLGIPDNYSLTWGSMSGSISNQTDLVNYIRQVKNDILNQTATQIAGITSVSEQIASLQANATQSSTKIMKLCTDVQELQNTTDKYKEIIDSINSQMHELSGMKIDISQNATAIAQNATKINELMTGIKISVDFQNEVKDIKSSIQNNQTAISNLQSQISSIDLSTINMRLLALESKFGEITVTGITVNYQSIDSVTTESDPRDIIVTASYSNGQTQDVTNQITITSNNTSVVTCDNVNKRINFVGPGNTKVIVNYQSFSKEINVSVSENTTEPTIKQFLGFADNYTDLLRTQGIDSVNGTWTVQNAPDIHTQETYAFWIITTQDVKSIGESVGNYDLNEILIDNYEYQGNSYKVYMTGPTQESTATIKITV